jgi:hypothetical protein
MRITYKIAALAALALISSGVNAQTNRIAPIEANPNAAVVEAYRMYKDATPVVKVPTAVEVPFTSEFIERLNFAVLDKTTNEFEPSLFVDKSKSAEIPVTVSLEPTSSRYPMALVDKNFETYEQFDVKEDDLSEVTIYLSSSQSGKPIVSSSLTVYLDNYVALPSKVEISAMTGSAWTILVNSTRMSSQTVNFPKTSASNWRIRFTYSQPLRISELKLNQQNASIVSDRGLRFLAQPNHQYRIYYDADRYVNAPVKEAANLYDDRDVVKVSATAGVSNPQYRISDYDNDGVPDISDNCVNTPNPDQEDINGNGRGDVCDDFDRDGIVNTKDNCPDQPNYDQRDTDGDKIGDACDKEESRITEKYKWVPWVGIGFAALVLIALFVMAVRHPGAKVSNTSSSNPPAKDPNPGAGQTGTDQNSTPQV